MPRAAAVLVSLALATFLFTCDSPTSSPAPLPEGIALVTGCGIDGLDTRNHALTRYFCYGGSTTVSYAFPDSVLDSVFAMLNRMGFYALPDTFTARDSVADGFCMVTPSEFYDLTVYRGGVVKRLYRDSGDYCGSVKPEADSLMAVFGVIGQTLRSSPEYQALPSHGCMCL